tara:strand:+ start:989 stop:1180 length:192 start_codon:yes stop_codon:yes gene_type:complete
MTIEQIYTKFTAGSQGFVTAVETDCGFGCSATEIKRITAKAKDAFDFQRIWENDDSWTDANNE